MIGRRLCLLVALLALAMPVFADEEEDFEIQEEGMLFDHARTGLLYPRSEYKDGQDVTHIPYYPTYYNDTRDMGPGKIYISHWEQDPPSFVTLYVRDDRPLQYSSAEIDLRVTVGQYDRARNLVPANQIVVRNIAVENGLNRIPLNIHNYAGDIISIRLIGVRQKIPYNAIEMDEN